MQRKIEMDAIEDKIGTEAIYALADAYRRFYKEHKELYRLIMNTVLCCKKQPGDVSQCILEPFYKVLEHTSFTQSEKMHWQRALRGIIHGFISEEDAGYFSHLPVSVDESFRIAIGCYIDGLTLAQERKS